MKNLQLFCVLFLIAVPFALEAQNAPENFENPVLQGFNPGHGIVLTEQKRPNLPWTPVKQDLPKDEFDNKKLASNWYFVRIPKQPFYSLEKGQLNISLQPEVIDSLVNSAMIVQKTNQHNKPTIEIKKNQISNYYAIGRKQDTGGFSDPFPKNI